MTGEQLDYLTNQWLAFTDDRLVNWAARGRFLRFIAYERTDGPRLDDPAAIELFLQQRWSLPVLRVPTSRISPTATSLHGTTAEAQQLGRFSLRRLSLFDQGNGYLVAHPDRYAQRGLWILLHELGHIAHHAETFLRVGIAYRNICETPSRADAELQILESSLSTPDLEQQADLFAARWLLVHPEGRRDEASRDQFGEIYSLISKAFDGVYPAAPAAVVNEQGHRLMTRDRGGPFPLHGLPVVRALWAFREALGDRLPTGTTEVSAPGTAVPGAALVSLSPGDVEDWLAGDEWDPVLVRHPRVQPSFYVPITPEFGTSDDTDITTTWRNLFKKPFAHGPRRNLLNWLGYHQQDRTRGLMLFPRTPAERMLDELEAIRS